MSFSHLPALLTTTFAALAHCLQQRSAVRLPRLLVGLLFAHGRRTVTSWFRPVGITEDFRPAYTTVCAVGRHTDSMAARVLSLVTPLLLGPCLTLTSDEDPLLGPPVAPELHPQGARLMVAIDDTPTPRYGPCVEGAGIHHNPTPGPAGEKHVYGHVWVTLAALAHHPGQATLAWPLQAQLYIRAKDLPKLPPERRRPFRTKLEIAAEQLAWLDGWVSPAFSQRWVVFDGAYAKRPVLRAARQHRFTVISRLRKDAALWSVPKALRPGQKRGRGKPPTYGKQRWSLAKRAGQQRGWQQVECVQYGEKVTKTIKTFLATWHPAGGQIRVVLVQEDDDWLPYFSTDPQVSTVAILEAMADRGAIEQTNKDVKEVWGAGQQQVRNVYSSEACFNLNLWMYTLVEAWAAEQADEALVDRQSSPWDSEPRRPSHADKRKALQKEILGKEIEVALSGKPSKEKMRALAQQLLGVAL